MRVREDLGRSRSATIRRAPESTESRRDSYWILGNEQRGFYICATAGPRDWRTALCVFDSEGAAEQHLSSFGDAQFFLDTLERYAAPMPGWMRRDPMLPGVRAVSARDLQRVLEGIGVGFVTLNPPPAEERTEALELLPAGDFSA